MGKGGVGKQRRANRQNLKMESHERHILSITVYICQNVNLKKKKFFLLGDLISGNTVNLVYLGLEEGKERIYFDLVQGEQNETFK